MKQRNVARYYVMIFGATFLLVSCGHVVRFFLEREDFWWTPPSLALSLDESRERVEVYVRGVLLQRELESGHVQLLRGPTPTVLGASDVRVRLNNVDRVKVARFPVVLGYSAAAGAALGHTTLAAQVKR